MAVLSSPKNFYILLVLCVMSRITANQASDQERKVYIVYMGNVVERELSLSSYHINMLQEVVDSRFATQSLVRSYTKSFNGFAAYLTVEEKEKLASLEEVVSVFPSTTLQPHTTRSWDFMGFPTHVQRNPTIESDTIIGVIDSGIWPESKSFNDKGFGPPPKKWKGVCKGGKNFTCNNKLIGARFYKSLLPSVNDSARDDIGHGTHTASTAAGNHVKDASFYGLAKGTVRGGVPSARIAAYKVCYAYLGCTAADILAAFDDAIADGVDIITISIGGSQPSPLEYDAISIGSLHASQKGILVVQSAGNDKFKRTVVSVAPWIFTVAASTTDRGIVSKVAIGNGTVFTGKAVNSFHLKGSSFPLVYGKQVSDICKEQAAKNCEAGCLENTLVKGKIVLCNLGDGVNEAFTTGAIGSVVLQSIDVSFVVPFPASGVNEPDFNAIESYINSTKVPKVDILTSQVIKNPNAPLVASFSSRGPNIIIPNILKPDVAAPGVEILAAFSPLASPSSFPDDKRSVKFNIISGTSMACPHVAGAAAYVKSLHPNWSSSAIRSALMTTAWKLNATKEDPLAEFSYGAGQIDPVKAVNPGLVYEIHPKDYAKMLCGLGYNSTKLRKIFGLNINCTDRSKMKPTDLNYPSMASRVGTSNCHKYTAFSAKFKRSVTNVGCPNSRYKATTSKSADYNISVKPDILKFVASNEKKSFEVIITGKIRHGKMLSASLEWSDGEHSVRSPIVVYSNSL